MIGAIQTYSRLAAAGVLAAGFTALGGVVLPQVGPAAAAEEAAYTEKDVERGRRLYAGKASCPFCHGWAGDGKGDPRSEGAGVSLRLAELDFEQVFEVVQCGRPGAAMPYHDRFAYSDGRCYGLKEAELEGDMPPRAIKTLQKHEIKAVAAYLTEKVVGRGLPVYYDECLEYFQSAASECENYGKRDPLAKPRETTQ